MKYLKSFNESINNDDIEDNLVELEDIGYTYKLESGYFTIEDDNRLTFNNYKINNSTPGTKVSLNSKNNSLDISLDDIREKFNEIYSVLTRIQSRVGKIHIWEFSFNKIVFLVLSSDTLSVSDDETKFINFTKYIGKFINNKIITGFKESLYQGRDYNVTLDEIKKEIKIDFSCSDFKSKRSIYAIKNSRIIHIYGNNNYISIDIDIIKVERKSITFKLNDWFLCDMHGNRNNNDI